jgi:hypothetical protein
VSADVWAGHGARMATSDDYSRGGGPFTARQLRDAWHRAWPTLLAVGTVTAVGGPAAVASYRHARTVVHAAGDPVMAPWLPLSVDGMLVAALVVLWVRRHAGDPAGWFPWAAFALGTLATLGANLAAVGLPDPLPEQPVALAAALAAAAAVAHEAGPLAYVVALWPPIALALTLELVALVAHRTGPADDDAAGLTGPQTDRTDDELTDDDEPDTGDLIVELPADWGPVGPLDIEPVTEELPVILTAGPDRSATPVRTGQTEPVQTGQTEQTEPAPARSGPVRPAADLGSQPDRPAELTDDELLVEVQALAEKLGKVPGREAVRELTGQLLPRPVGSGRADRLRARVTAPGKLRAVR